MIVAALGGAVSGSDRSRDQGRTPEKFAGLERQGIECFPQDGSGPQAGQILVASAAIEDSVPDVAAANALGLPRMTRSEEHTSELQSLMRISYAVFCLKKKKQKE